MRAPFEIEIEIVAEPFQHEVTGHAARIDGRVEKDGGGEDHLLPPHVLRELEKS